MKASAQIAIVTLSTVMLTAALTFIIYVVVVQRTAQAPQAQSQQDTIVITPRDKCEQQQIDRMADNARREFKMISDYDIETYQLSAKTLCKNWEESLPKLVRKTTGGDLHHD